MIIGLIFCQQTGIFGEATLAKRGPKTAAGHAAVRYNAVTHGLLSSAPLIKGQEDQRDWDDLREGIMESLAPVGRLEEARDEARAGLELNPGFTIARLRTLAISDHPVYLAGRERFYEGLRKAGVPEG